MPLQITKKSEEYSVSPQLSPEDVIEAAKLGFKTIINNRPNGEGGESQPTSEQIQRAAKAQSLAYFHIPVIPNDIQPNQVETFNTAYANAPKPILGFCKTGNRAARMLELCNTNQAAANKGPLAWLKSKCLITKLWRLYQSKSNQSY